MFKWSTLVLRALHRETGRPANSATMFDTGRVMRQAMSMSGLGLPSPGRVEWVRNSSEVYTSWGGVGKPMSMSGSVWIALPASVFSCGTGRGVTVLVSARRMVTVENILTLCLWGCCRTGNKFGFCTLGQVAWLINGFSRPAGFAGRGVWGDPPAQVVSRGR